MTSQTTGAAPGSSSVWQCHADGPLAYEDCAPLLSLADGAAGDRVRRAPAGGCGGGDRVVGGPCASAAAPAVPCPEPPSPRDGEAACRGEGGSPSQQHRPAPQASAGTRRGLPAAPATKTTSRRGSPA